MPSISDLQTINTTPSLPGAQGFPSAVNIQSLPAVSQKLTPVVWTPKLTASSGNPNLGSTGGTRGTYILVGSSLALVQAVFTFGGSGISQGTGSYQVAPPVMANASFAGNQPVGTWLAYDGSTNSANGICIIGSSGTQVLFLESAWGASGIPLLDGGTPLTFVAGGYFLFTITYQAV